MVMPQSCIYSIYMGDKVKMRFTTIFVVIVMMIIVIMLYNFTIIQSSRINYMEVYPWELKGEKVSGNSTISYIKTEGIETYLLSAVARPRKSQNLQIIINSLDFTKGRGGFLCCLICDKYLVTVPASFHDIHRHFNTMPAITQTFYPAPFDATQYSCEVPESDLKSSVTKATLTLSGSCSNKKEDYLTVVYPKRISNGLAICAKVVCGNKLDVSKLIEWFEMQKLLGVDKIVLFDYKCSSAIQNVFKYYVTDGILEVVPFSLPGNPERGYDLKNRVYPQFYHDEEITVMDCHERLSGYKFILITNVDDILLPKSHNTIKELLKSLTESHPKAGGFYFQVQSHVEEWGKDGAVPGSYFQQYLKSTKPTSKFPSYIYIHNRSHSPKQHSFKNILPFQTHHVEPSLATLHHYGKCPREWKECVPDEMLDKTVSRYKEMVLKNMQTVLNKLSIRS